MWICILLAGMCMTQVLKQQCTDKGYNKLRLLVTAVYKLSHLHQVDFIAVSEPTNQLGDKFGDVEERDRISVEMLMNCLANQWSHLPI